MQAVCPDVIKFDLTHTVEAHAIDETVEIYCDVGPPARSSGGVGLVKTDLNQLQNYHVVRSEKGRGGTKIIFWCYDNAKRVPVIKGWMQARRTAKVGGTGTILDVKST